MTERIESIDALRGIGIFLVVLGHAYTSGNSFALVYIYSFHMPLFFFVSGYLFSGDRFPGYAGFLRNKLRTRLVPYLFFFLISYGIRVVLASLSTGMSVFTLLAMDNFQPLLFDLTNLVRGNGASLETINAALWFLPCLFMAELYFYTVYKLAGSSRGKLLFVLTVLSLAAYCESIYLNIRMPWSADAALPATVFYGLGYLWKELTQKRNFPVLSSGKSALLLSGVLTVLCLLLAGLNGRVDMNGGVYGGFLYFYGAALAGMYSYLLISPWLSKQRLVLFLGRNALIILGVHLYLYIFVLFLLNEAAGLVFAHPVALQADLYVFLVTALTLVFAVPIIYFLNTFAPFLLGKKPATISMRTETA